jgi:hypothetical protein
VIENASHTISSHRKHGAAALSRLIARRRQLRCHLAFESLLAIVGGLAALVGTPSSPRLLVALLALLATIVAGADRVRARHLDMRISMLVAELSRLA